MKKNLTICPRSETLEKVRVAKFHPATKSILSSFPKNVRREIGKSIFELQKGEKLTMPLARPMSSVGSNVQEIRIKDRSGAFRVFYLTVADDGVYIFHAFMKKTQTTPKREIDLGIKRLREMLKNEKT